MLPSTAKFCGPERPVSLAPNTRVRVVIETTEDEEAEAVSFLQTAQALRLNGPKDWSERLDAYSYRQSEAKSERA